MKASKRHYKLLSIHEFAFIIDAGHDFAVRTRLNEWLDEHVCNVSVKITICSFNKHVQLFSIPIEG